MIDQRLDCLFFNHLSFFSCLTNAVTVCKAKDAFNLVECHVFLGLYHISVEFRGCTEENKLKLTK